MPVFVQPNEGNTLFIIINICVLDGTLCLTCNDNFYFSNQPPSLVHFQRRKVYSNQWGKGVDKVWCWWINIGEILGFSDVVLIKLLNLYQSFIIHVKQLHMHRVCFRLILKMKRKIKAELEKRRTCYEDDLMSISHIISFIICCGFITVR